MSTGTRPGQPAIGIGRRPYPGLRAFRRDEADRFFGRDEQIDALLDQLAESRFLAVLGTSGSGKSSLVRAGLLPALDGGVLLREPDGPWPGTCWSIAELRPGERPFERLARALLEDTGWGESLMARYAIERHGSEPAGDPPCPAHAGVRYAEPEPADPVRRLVTDLRRGGQALGWLLGVVPLPPGERLLILVDQFEELFRYHGRDSADAAAFVALLLGAVAHPDCHVVITLRSEFLGHCARYPDLPEAINAGLFLTPRLRPTELADAIAKPPRLAAFRGEVERDLVRALLEDASYQQDRLPLLQHLLMRLWDRAEPDEQGVRRLTPEDLEDLGGMQAALDDHAEEAFRELNPDPDWRPGQPLSPAQRTAEQLFRALTERTAGGEDVRRPVSLAEAAEAAGVDTDALLAAAAPFRRPDRSFLMPPPAEDGTKLRPDNKLDITHEALIRQWRRLQAWTAAETEDAELYRRLESAAERRSQGQGMLWTDPDLQLALDWRERREPSAPWARRYGGDFEQAMAFLDESRDTRERLRAAEAERGRRELRRAWVITIASVIALALTLTLAGWAWVEKQNALAAEEAAKGHATRAEEQREIADAQRALAERQEDVARCYAGEADRQRRLAEAETRKAERAKQRRTEQLFESSLTHAALLADGEDYARAWRVLGDTLALDDRITADRRHARNLLAGYVDLRRGVADRVYRGADASLIDLALSPDGRWLVAGGERATLVVFDAATGELVRRLEGHDSMRGGGSGAVGAVRFTADGSQLYSAGGDRQILRWSVPDWQQLDPWQAPAEVWSIALSPDETRLASAGKGDGITIWRTDTGEVERTLSGESSLIADGTALAFLPDGRLVAGGFKGQVGIWDLDSGEEQVLQRIHTDQVNGLAVSPDGTLIASGSSDKTIILWNADSGRPLRRLRGHENDILGLTFDPTGRYLLSASKDNTLRLWDVASGTSLRVHQGHEAVLWSVLARTAPDGTTRAYTAANDGTLRRWPLALPEQWVWDLEGHQPISNLVLPDQRLHLLGTVDGTIHAFPLPVGSASRRDQGSPGTPLEANAEGAESPLAAQNRQPSAEPDQAPTAPEPLLTLPDAHGSTVLRFAIAPDGNTVATASTDDTARLWHLWTQAPRMATSPP